MMKKISILLLFVLASAGLSAQQSPQYTQYIFNDFVINPAIASIHDYYQIRMNNRYQWIGIKDAPITYTLSVYGPHQSQPMGWGAHVFFDTQGATGKFGFYGAYAYNLNLKEDMNLSMGLNLGLIQYKVDLNKIDFLEEETTMTQNKYTYMKPDATFGVHFYTSRYYAGFAIDQLFNSKVELDRNSDITSYNRLTSHFTLVGGYKFTVSRDIDMEPSMLFRATAATVPQLEVTARGIFRKMAWAGITGRTSDAITIMIGYNYKDQLYAGYSYDITLNKLRHTSSGSHEIMIGARFNKVRDLILQQEEITPEGEEPSE